jgi:hypothetical protein
MTNKADRAELSHCIEVACLEPGRAGQIKEKLQDESWEDVAIFCAELCQERALHLKPWENPPCVIEDPDDPDERLEPDKPGPASDGRRQAAALLKRMLAAGVSRYHPDPLRALEEVERRR